jgi:hypothetical protein
MANEVVTSNRDLATLPLAEAIDAYTPSFAAELPSHIRWNGSNARSSPQ